DGAGGEIDARGVERRLDPSPRPRLIVRKVHGSPAITPSAIPSGRGRRGPAAGGGGQAPGVRRRGSGVGGQAARLWGTNWFGKLASNQRCITETGMPDLRA